MLQGITRLSTPAFLCTLDDDGDALEITDFRVYREMHGYSPIPHSDQLKLFKDVASREESEFVVEFGSPVAFLGSVGDLCVRIDMLFLKRASDELLSSFRTTGEKLFSGPLGDEICVSSGTVTGVGIVCCEPHEVIVEALTVRDLLDEFRMEIEALLEMPNDATRSECASHFNAAEWLNSSLQHLLSEPMRRQVSCFMDAIRECRIRIPTERERTICYEIFKLLEI